MSNNLNFNFPDYISEERSIDDEEDYDECVEEAMIETAYINNQMELNKANQELAARCAQLAPVMDRLGRLLIDLAPHVAMMGSTALPPVTQNISNISMITHNGSDASANLRNNDPIQRLMNPSISRRTTTGIGGHADRNQLSSNGRTLSFEIPVMLNPGELLSVSPTHNNLLGEGNVHLHLSAQVHLPRMLIC